jgi:deoxyadenosine/deoxycytidine kinase
MLISITGNIGSGKTTLAQLLAKHLHFEAQFEDETQNPYVHDFYNDMGRWAFNLHVHFMVTGLQRTSLAQRSGMNVVQDQSLAAHLDIFAKNLHSSGILSTRDFDTLHNLSQNVLNLVKPPDLVICLKGSISKIVDQIASRGRDYEDNIRIDYLRKLNERFDEWFANYSAGKKLEINIDELDFIQNPEHLGIVLNKVKAEFYGLFTN